MPKNHQQQQDREPLGVSTRKRLNNSTTATTDSTAISSTNVVTPEKETRRSTRLSPEEKQLLREERAKAKALAKEKKEKEKRDKKNDRKRKQDLIEDDTMVNLTHLVSDDDDSADDTLQSEETVKGANTPETYTTRVTLKLKVSGGKNPIGRAVGQLKELLTQIIKFNRYASIAPWYDTPHKGIVPINNPNDLKADVNLLTSYFPKFMNKKRTDNKPFNEYVKINIGHSVEILDLIGDLGTWFQNGEHAMYVDMLQCERSKEAGF